MLPAPTQAGYCAQGMASCAATAIAMRAAMQGIAMRTLAVKVESDSDARGLVGIPMLRRHSEICVCQSKSVRMASTRRNCASWPPGVKHTHRSVARCGLDHRLRSMLPLFEMWTARTRDSV